MPASGPEPISHSASRFSNISIPISDLVSHHEGHEEHEGNDSLEVNTYLNLIFVNFVSFVVKQ
jgi:hypothetical protein